MQPPENFKGSRPAVQTAEQAKPSRRERLRRVLRFLTPLYRLPVIGGLGRTTWLILSSASFAGIVVASFWSPIAPVERALPARFSRDWWISSLEFHRELQFASFDNEDIESVAVARTPAGQERIFVGGRNAFLAFSDDQGRTWKRVNYDPLMGGFAITGKRAPFPDIPANVGGVPQETTAKPTNTNTGSPAAKREPKPTVVPPRGQQNANPAQQYQPQQQTAPPSTNKKPTAKSSASLGFLSVLPVVWASEKPSSQSTGTSAGSSTQASTAGASLRGNVQPQPRPGGVPAICRADDGSMILVLGRERAAVSNDLGETWRATSLDSRIEQVSGTLVWKDFVAGTLFLSGNHASRLETGAAQAQGKLGDTLLVRQALPDPSIHPRSAYRISPTTLWAITGRDIGSPSQGASNSSFLYHTNDGGAQWLASLSSIPVVLHDIAFSEDGSNGYIVGAQGVILRTTNAGASWQPLTREAMNPGQPPSAAQAGQTYWRLPPPWTYLLLVFSFGWLTIAILISAVPGANTLGEVADWFDKAGKPLESPGGVALISVSDRPLGEDDVDRLGFRNIARGVAGFLRNPKTQLPVTLAINGHWGTGKSSLMNLISGDLKRAGFRPVWFNAWHHQEDENLLASLLQAVRSDASPPLIREGGVTFRLRLGWFRFGRYYPRALAMVAIFIGLWAGESWLETPKNGVNVKRYFSEQLHVGPAAQAAGNAGSSSPAAQNASSAIAQPQAGATGSGLALGNSGKAAGTDSQDSTGWLASFVNYLGLLHDKSDDLTNVFKLPKPLAALYLLFQIFPAALRKLKAFTANPAALLHSAAPGVSEKEIEAQTSFRMRFAREFADVTQALGNRHRLVIFVDDLDRCRPANVAEMMEAINYVSVAGECAFVLGIETEAVRASLGLSFDAIAQEVDPTAVQAPAVASVAVFPPDSLEAKRANRKEFACRYIEKLINIEMNVPQLDAQKKQALFSAEQAAPPATDPFERARKIARMGRILEPAAMFILVLALGWGAGRMVVHLVEWQAADYFQDELETQKAVLGAVPVANPPALPNAPVNSSLDSVTQSAAQADAGKTSDVQPGEAPLPAALMGTPLSWIFMAGLFTVVIQLLAREPIPPAKDSQDFSRALGAWSWVAGDALDTPRAAKRFLNRLRFLAMRQRPPAVQLPGLMRLLLTAQQQKRAIEQEESRAGAAAHKPIPDAILVALAALEVYPKETGLNAGEIRKIVDKLGELSAATVENKDLRSGPFLAELANLAAPLTTGDPEFGDMPGTGDILASLSKADAKGLQEPSPHALLQPRGFTKAAKNWSARAADKIIEHLDEYSGLVGDVEFT